MNDKGQTLVIFIIFLPIIFLVIAIVYDLGVLAIEKQSVDSGVRDAISYGLDNLDDESNKQNIERLLNENVSGSKSIQVNDQMIIVNVKYTYKSVFNNVLKNKYDVDITYRGYIEDDKKKIIKG